MRYGVCALTVALLLLCAVRAQATQIPNNGACYPIDFPIINTATTIQLITADSLGGTTVVCGLFLWANGTTNVQVEYGTGLFCTAGVVAFMGNATVPISLTQQTAALYNSPITIPPGNNVCLVNSGVVGLTGMLSYYVYGSRPSAASGAWLFAKSDATVYSVLNANANNRTLLQSNVWTANTGIQPLVSVNRVWQSCTSDACTATATFPIVMYDCESGVCPAGEYSAIPASVATACTNAHGNGNQCLVTFDATPNGINVGACTFNLASGSLPSINWAQVDRFNIQEQQLANQANCSGVGQFTAYAIAVEALIHRTAAQPNPNTIITAQVSLSLEDAATSMTALESVNTVVSGIYVAYPSPCTNCTPGYLNLILTDVNKLHWVGMP